MANRFDQSQLHQYAFKNFCIHSEVQHQDKIEEASKNIINQ
jgi:hypothetical protein